jgi:predicted dehydrogenase
MIKVGIVGIGFMGVTHFKALEKVKGVRVAAICTRDTKKLSGDWRAIKGNFGDAGGRQDLSKVARYDSIEKILAADSIDLIDICLPTHLHREVSIAALRAGKHVLVEKPIALNLKDADAMIAAAQKAGKLLMVAHALRFFPAFAEAAEIIKNEKYGKLRALHLKRIISKPKWASEPHFEDAEKSGGPILDLHIHDTDFVLHLLGVPDRVQATGFRAANGMGIYINSQYIFEEQNIAISAQSGALSMPGVSFEHGFDLYLENATLRFNSLFTGAEILLATEDGKTRRYTPRRPEAFVAQLQHAVDCARDNRVSEIISGANARASLAVCLQERHALLTGKPVRVKA